MSVRQLVVDTTLPGAAFDTILTPAADITAASVAHALNATFSDTEVETALNALGTKINLILAALDAAGITA